MYISGNPWKRSTTMTTIANNYDEINACANKLRQSALETDRQLKEDVGKKVPRYAMDYMRKEMELAEHLNGELIEENFIKKCMKEEAVRDFIFIINNIIIK